MSGDVVFSLSCGGSGGPRVVAWDLESGSTRRTFSCEAQGGGSCIALVSRTYLLCALSEIPFIYVWHLKKVPYSGDLSPGKIVLPNSPLGLGGENLTVEILCELNI